MRIEQAGGESTFSADGWNTTLANRFLKKLPLPIRGVFFSHMWARKKVKALWFGSSISVQCTRPGTLLVAQVILYSAQGPVLVKICGLKTLWTTQYPGWAWTSKAKNSCQVLYPQIFLLKKGYCTNKFLSSLSSLPFRSHCNFYRSRIKILFIFLFESSIH